MAMHDIRKQEIRNWMVVFLLTAAMLFSFVDRFGLALMIEPLKRDLQINDAQIGLLNGVAFGLFFAFMGMPCGYLADRWSRKGTIILGVGTWSLATSLCGLANSFGSLLGARIFVGAGEAALAPTSYSMIHDRFSAERLARAISVFQIGSFVGSGVAFFVAGTLYDFFSKRGVHFFLPDGRPWQETFICLGAPGIIFLPLIWMIQDHKPNPLERNAARPISMKQALQADPARYILLFAGMSCIVMLVYSFLSWLPTILIREYGFTAGKVGSTYGLVVAICAPLGLIVGGSLTDSLVRRGVSNAHALTPLLAAFLALPLSIYFLYASSAVEVLAVAGLLHFTVALPMGSSPAFIQLITPKSARGQISALYVLVLNVVGLGIAPTVIGALSARDGSVHGLHAAVGYAIIPIMALGIGLFWLLSRLSSKTAVEFHDFRAAAPAYPPA